VGGTDDEDAAVLGVDGGELGVRGGGETGDDRRENEGDDRAATDGGDGSADSEKIPAAIIVPNLLAKAILKSSVRLCSTITPICPAVGNNCGSLQR
jgi:hypothetical protein